MANVSNAERVSHVVRRLSMGTHPDLLDGLPDADAAISRALDLSTPPAPTLDVAAPASDDAGTDLAAIEPVIAWWFGRMASPDRLIEERLVWFWHDHFATSLAKVRQPYLMWKQHLTLRQHATANFADLLKAIARDPAMLLYLDGIKNVAASRNENFGRECLELFTMGRDGGYTQDDVVAASRSFTGWIVDVPGRVADKAGSPWNAVFVARRHDNGSKTLLGRTGAYDMDGALDVILDNPSTATFVATKLYRELVGTTPSDQTAQRLAGNFRRDYAILPLVEAITQDPGFTGADAMRAKYRTPVEKVVAILQAAGTDHLGVDPSRRHTRGGDPLIAALRRMSYLPFVPPNVGGYPKGSRLVGPGNLMHSFDLLNALGTAPATTGSTKEVFARFGVFDVTDQSRAVVEAERHPARRFALAATSPEVDLV